MEGMMTDVFLSESQLKLREQVREYLAKEVSPFVEKIDHDDTIPESLIKKLLGEPVRLTALSVPKTYNGMGLSTLDVCVVAEEVGYVCPALIPLLEIAQLFVHGLLIGGTEQQKRLYLTKLAEGMVGCYALTDEGPGSDPASMKTIATKVENGYILNGKKRFVTFGDISEFYIIFAKTSPEKGGKGISGFVVDGKPKGLVFESHAQTMGLRGHRAFNIRLDNMFVPEKNLLGKQDEGLKLALEILNTTRISLAAGFTGLAKAAFDVAIKFAKERIVAGKPIIENQAISFPLSELAAKIDASRLLTYRVALMHDKGIKHKKETSIAKFYAAETLIQAVELGSRVLGAYGASPEYNMERYLRDAFSWISAQGTIEVQKLVVSREL
jgi:alkylation response protein AidB-like acyl-CoA dehydrogenase